MCTVCAPVAPKTEKVFRVYLRCPDCLSTVTVNSKKIKTGFDYQRFDIYKYDNTLHRWKAPVCSLCDCEMEVMGEVEGNSYVRHDMKCACDARCTNAPGPNCDCQCRGEFHGTGRMVEYVAETGRVIVKETPEAKAVADEFHASCEKYVSRWRSIYGAVVDQKNSGSYLHGSDYGAYCEGVSVYGLFAKAKKLKTHKARISKIQNLTEGLK
jgi:hypothetical protein